MKTQYLRAIGMLWATAAAFAVLAGSTAVLSGSGTVVAGENIVVKPADSGWGA